MTQSSQSERLTKILLEWKFRLNKAQIGHYISTERYLRGHYILGVPLVAASAFVSAALFLDLNQASQLLKSMVIILSLSTTTLASLQTFLRFGEKSELHRAKAARYGAVRRRVELFLAQDHVAAETQSFLLEVQAEWNHIAADAPVTARSIRVEVSKMLRAEMKEHQDLTS